MAGSEAEFERLYQEFVNRGGGAITLANGVTDTTGTASIVGSLSNVNTPVDYYNQSAGVGLTPSSLAQLQANQAQYNRASALQTISSEISANNFSNPYASVALNGNAKFNSLISSPGGQGAISLANALQLFSGSNIGGSAVVSAAILAGLASAFNIDFDKLMLAGIVGATAISMFDKLGNHTANQAQDIPGKIDEVSQLSDMRKQFGETNKDSCSLFNELMGIMSGAFDGVLDFIDKVGDKLMSLLNATGIPQVLSDIADAISGVIGNVSGPLSGAISQIISDITNAIAPLLNGITDAISAIADAASGLMNAVTEMANQIANEISGLLNAAAEIANKLAALAVAAATLDPCKLNVLMNTGSSEMKNAAALLNTPSEQAFSGVDIPVETDVRADPREVNAVMSNARDIAKTQPGVPQSPMTSTASLYQPFNAYLYDLFDSIKTIFGDFENIPSEDGGTVVSAKPATGSKSPSENASNIDEVLERSISNPVNTVVDSTPTIAALEGMARGGAVNPASSTEAVNRNPVNNAVASDADSTRTRFGTGPRSITARADQKWRDDFYRRTMRIVSGSRALARDIRKYIRDDAKFASEGQKTEAEIIRERMHDLNISIKDHRRNTIKGFKYKTSDGNRVEAKETEFLREYYSRIKPSTERFVANAERILATDNTTWSSIKQQAILDE